ncbi:hypothetical protein OG589_41435 [Sphaerisporangium sp. NBC_01403]|uniref:hypothetical protein n=1 Tax=Sphaerisporangium sp. NBC_01403 TaxID=2903599 RepID=UPI00324A6519
MAAVAAVTVTVGAQWWDRSAWVADRYPAEVIKDVGRGQSATLHGMSWQLSVAVRPRSAGDNPKATTLVAAVQVTPVSAEEITRFSMPTFEARDRAGRTWDALPATTLSSFDLHAGKVARLTVVAAVPNELKDTAELVLSYSNREMLRFAR